MGWLARCSALCAVVLVSPLVQAENAPQSAAEVAAEASDEARATSEVGSLAVTKIKDSPAVVTVISGEDIRNSGARDLIDILSLVPGYFFGFDTEGVVGAGLRGLWGYEGKILFIIDGKEMNEDLFSTMQLGNEFPVEFIERVEVLRGPGSVIYGGSAELSVVNVVTRGLQGSTDVQLTGTYGAMTGGDGYSGGYGHRSVSVSGRYIFDDVPGLSTYASISGGQGQRSVHNFVDNAGAKGVMNGASSLDPTTAQLGIAYRNVQASFLYHRMRTTSITGLGLVLPAAQEVSFDSYHGEISANFHPTNRVEIVPRFNFTSQRPWNNSEPEGGLFYDKTVRRLRGRLLARWAVLDQLQIAVGADTIFDQARLLSPADESIQTSFKGSNSISYQTYGAYTELFSENPIVNVTAGIRYDYHSALGGQLAPRFVLLRRFGPVGLKALYSYSFRNHGIENLNLSHDLRPERATIFEFEGTVDITPQQAVSANVYDMTINAPIVYTSDPNTGVEEYQNLGRQGTRGFELAYRLRGALGRLEANYSFYAPTVSDDLPFYTVPGHSEAFLSAPAHKGTLTATLKPWPWLSLSPTAIVFSERFTRGPEDAAGKPTAVSIPAQLLANFYVHTENVGVPGVSVGLGVYNIFGANYRFVRASASPTYADDHAPVPGLDREVMLRVQYQAE